MTKPLLIATSIALALSISACGRDDRADAQRTAPGANIATTPPPSSPVGSSPSSSGGTSGMGATGEATGPAGSGASPPGNTAPGGMSGTGGANIDQQGNTPAYGAPKDNPTAGSGTSR